MFLYIKFDPAENGFYIVDEDFKSEVFDVGLKKFNSENYLEEEIKQIIKCYSERNLNVVNNLMIYLQSYLILEYMTVEEIEKLIPEFKRKNSKRF
jgi:hypothetical protein